MHVRELVHGRGYAIVPHRTTPCLYFMALGEVRTLGAGYGNGGFIADQHHVLYLQ